MRLIPLSKNQFTKVDDDAFEVLNAHEWCVLTATNGCFYAVRNDKAPGKKGLIYLHRDLMEAPKGFEVSHLDGDTLNNQRSNLKIIQRNGNKPRKGFVGVEYIPKGVKHWRAHITVNGERKRLGTFMTELEAAHARDEAAVEAWGEYAILNFPKQTMNENDTLIDAITEAVTRTQSKPQPLPMIMVEGCCFLSDAPFPFDGSLGKLLESTIPQNESYETSRSRVTRFEPDPQPLTEDCGGPRYLFTTLETAV